MTILHDPGAADDVLRRAERLRLDSTPRFGKMSVDQMLWHVSQALESALGRVTVAPAAAPLPRPIWKWIVLNAPWPKGKAPTMKEFLAVSTHDFDQQKARLPGLIAEMVGRRLDDPWPWHGMFGRMSGRDWSQLQWRHLDHHLRQFGV